MSTGMKAQVNTECDASMVTYGLDHLLSASVSDGDVSDNSVFSMLVSKESTAGWDDYEHTTDSLQAIRDRGDAEWTTGSGGSASAIADAVWDEATSGHTTSGTFGEQLKTDVDAILADTNEIQSDDVPGSLSTLSGKVDVVDGICDAILVDTAVIGSAGAGLTAVPWNAAWDAEVQSECNDALVALALDHLVSASVAGGDIADNSIIAKLVSKESTADWDDFANTTDSLQAIADNIEDSDTANLLKIVEAKSPQGQR